MNKPRCPWSVLVGRPGRCRLAHFHATIRIDGPGGAHDPAPAWAYPDLLITVIQTAAAAIGPLYGCGAPVSR